MDSIEVKRLEAAQQEMLNRFQKITLLVPGVIYQFKLRPDGSACIPYVSDAFHSLFRLNPEDVREDASKALMRAHPDDLENLMASIHESARNMTPWQHEYRLKFDDGTERWVFGNSLPQREADGSILWHGFITDTTKRRLMEEALREREETFRRLFEDVNYPIALLKDGRFIDCNTATLELLGYCTKRELINRSPDEISPSHQPDGRSSVEKSAEMIAIAQRKNSHQFEWVVRKTDGSDIPVDATLTTITLDGEPIVHVLFRDAIERKRAEASARAEQEAMASRAAVRKLAAHAEKLREDERKLIARDVHDELGQVLSVLRMDIALLKDRSGINNAAMDGIERNMLALVDRVIQGVRNVSSSLHPAPLEMGIIAAIEWQCAEFEVHSGIPCSLKVAGNIADNFDENQALALFRIVQESLTNVARHAGATRVEVAVVADNGAIKVEIRDNGKGFDPEEHIGNGSFGLLGMRERAISIGGELNVASKLGQGTSVTLRIPDDPGKELFSHHGMM